MPYKLNFKQKSPQKRFLFILGLVTFLACFTIGLMILAWGQLIEKLNMPVSERLVLGSLLIIYSLIRFLRFFKKEPDEE